MSDPKFSCRYYRKKYPEVDELVMVTVRRIADMGAYVGLKEYDDIEGMILLSELSRRRIRSIQKLIRVGRDEVAIVLRVDKEKGYIDLSKRRVSSDDVVALENKYNSSKIVQAIMRNVAEKNNVSLVELHEAITWPLYDKFGHALDAFKKAITDPEDVFKELSVPNDIYQSLMKSIRRKLTPAPVKLRADVDITCFAYEGICAIRRGIHAAESLSTEEVTIRVRLVAPPHYVATANTLDKSLGVVQLEESLKLLQNSLVSEGGSVTIKREAREIDAEDEKELHDLMQKHERENAEVSGDEESSEE